MRGKVFLMIMVFASQTLFTRSGLVGINYGLLGNNLPPPKQVVALLKSKGIERVRIFDPNQEVLEALRGSNLKVVIGVVNDDLANLASSTQATTAWLNKYIVPYNDVSFLLLTVGNEVIPGPLAQYVLPALQNFQESLKIVGKDQSILVSTVVGGDVLGTSYPPSQGSFKESVSETLNAVVKFLHSKASPILVNVYPYFAWASDPTNIKREFALFESPSPAFIDQNREYYNLFDATVDAYGAAIAKAAGAEDMVIVVAETGWPSAGNPPYTSVENARIYNNNLKAHVLSGGTPRNPIKLDAYIFALFNENQKADAVEQSFGCFYPNMQPVYPLW